MLKDFDWIRKCILSCNTEFQLKSCFKLVDFFKIKYDDCYELLDILMKELLDMQSRIMILA